MGLIINSFAKVYLIEQKNLQATFRHDCGCPLISDQGFQFGASNPSARRSVIFDVFRNWQVLFSGNPGQAPFDKIRSVIGGNILDGVAW